MIFKLSTLLAIKSGTVTLAFRKWKKPAVQKGSRIRTEMAVIEVSGITEIDSEQITNDDAVNAGFKDLEQLLKAINSVGEGKVYKIEVRYYSEDPRIALRQNTDVSEKDLDNIKRRLERLDRSSKEGAWTAAVLMMIKDNPRLRAADLASKMNQEKDALKINIRKLKNLGLTISHDVGYSLSPLGEIVLKSNRVIR
jgi:hypothetical protein